MADTPTPAPASPAAAPAVSSSSAPVAPVAPVVAAPSPTPAPATPAPAAPPAPTSVPTPLAPSLAKAVVDSAAKPPATPVAPADSDVANLPQPPVEEKKLKGLPEKSPFRLIEIDPAKLDEGAFVQAIQKARDAFSAGVHPFGAPVAHPDYPATGFLQGFDAATGKIRIMFDEAEGNPLHAVDLPAGELFDPRTALLFYRQLTAPAPEAPAAPSGVASAIVGALLAIGVLFGMTACGTTAGVAQKPSAAQTAPAKLGSAALAVVKAVETPAVVQAEAQIATAEVLQRGVAENKQPIVAGWCACISRAAMDLVGTTNPTSADFQAAIEKETGPITDPEFPIVLASALDVWTVAKAAIPANASAATVEQYLYAAATGVQAGSAGYLSPATATVNWLTLKRRHQAFIVLHGQASHRVRL